MRKLVKSRKVQADIEEDKEAKLIAILYKYMYFKNTKRGRVRGTVFVFVFFIVLSKHKLLVQKNNNDHLLLLHFYTFLMVW